MFSAPGARPANRATCPLNNRRPDDLARRRTYWTLSSARISERPLAIGRSPVSWYASTISAGPGGLDLMAARALCVRLGGLALLTVTGTAGGGVVALHDVVRDFLREDLGPARLVDLHRMLVRSVATDLPLAPSRTSGADAVTAWWELDESAPYLWDHLIEHFLAGKQVRGAAAVAGGPALGHRPDGPVRPDRAVRRPVPDRHTAMRAAAPGARADRAPARAHRTRPQPGRHLLQPHRLRPRLGYPGHHPRPRPHHAPARSPSAAAGPARPGPAPYHPPPTRRGVRDGGGAGRLLARHCLEPWDSVACHPVWRGHVGAYQSGSRPAARSMSVHRFASPTWPGHRMADQNARATMSSRPNGAVDHGYSVGGANASAAATRTRPKPRRRCCSSTRTRSSTARRHGPHTARWRSPTVGRRRCVPAVGRSRRGAPTAEHARSRSCLAARRPRRTARPGRPGTSWPTGLSGRNRHCR